MAKATYFPAEVIEMNDLVELDDNKCVLNITGSFETEIVPGLTESIEPRITLFSRKAREAVEKLKEGINVVFTGVKRNPRAWTSEASNKRVETVELIAEGFTVVPKSKYEAVVKALEEKESLFDIDLLAYTDEDRAADLAMAAATETDSDGDDDDADI